MNAVCVIFSLLSPANWGRMPGAAEQARLASGVGGGGGARATTCTLHLQGEHQPRVNADTDLPI